MIQTIAKFFTSGGSFMWLILAILAGAVAVMIERAVYYLVVCRNDTRQLVADAAQALNEDRPADALNIVMRKKAPVNNILAVAVDRYSREFTYEDIKQGVEEAAIKEIPKLSKRLNYLALFANISTLAGLLGTIFGLQASFSSLGLAEAAQKATMLASGISQAMNTTAFGLLVAIPCMIAYSVLTNKKAALVEDLDEAVVKMMNYLERKVKV